MAIKPSAAPWTVKEQIIDDLVSGLKIQFAVMPESDAPFRLRIFGDLENGNREFLFDADGNEAGAGVALVATCPPNWLREVTDATDIISTLDDMTARVATGVAIINADPELQAESKRLTGNMYRVDESKTE